MQENNTEGFNPFYKPYNMPPSDVNLTAQIKQQKNRLKYLTYFLFFTFLFSLSLFAYVYFIETSKEVVIETKTNQIEEKNLSKEDVEAKNLASIEKLPTSESKQFSYKEYSNNYANINSSDLNQAILFLKSSEQNGILTVKKIPEAETMILEKNIISFVPKIEFDYKSGYKPESLNRAMIDKHISDIILELSGIEYTGVEISYSYMVFTDYYNFLEKFKEALSQNNKNLYVSIAPKWGESPDYNRFINVYKPEFFDIDYVSISNIADQIRVNAFYYTTENSTLAGPISPKLWVEQIIRFMISKNVPREKIILGINTNAYEWTTRDYTDDYYKNYIWTEKEISNVYSSQETKLLLDTISEISDLESINERVIEYKKDGIGYILVIPQDEYINSLKQLSIDYGLGGFFLR